MRFLGQNEVNHGKGKSIRPLLEGGWRDTGRSIEENAFLEFAQMAPRVLCIRPMSANEVLEQVKALPPRERRKFFASIHELETATEGRAASPGRGELARQLMGAGRRLLKPGADPVGDLIREREHDDKLDQADERR